MTNTPGGSAAPCPTLLVAAALCLVAAATVGAAVASGLRSGALPCGAPAADEPEPQPEAARQWLDAVAACDTPRALRAAALLTAAEPEPDAPGAPLATRGALELGEVCGVNSRFFNHGVIPFDMVGWREDWETARLADALSAGAEDPAMAIFQGVLARVRIRLQEAPTPREPLEAWRTGEGSFSEVCHLLVRLLSKAGVPARLVYLPNKEMTGFVHVFVEADPPGGTVALDPRMGWAARASAASLADADTQAAGWPAEWRSARSMRMATVVAHPGAYRPSNRALRKALERAGSPGASLLDGDPEAEVERLRAGGAFHSVDFWPIPFEIAKSHPAFPRECLRRHGNAATTAAASE